MFVVAEYSPYLDYVEDAFDFNSRITGLFI